MDLKSLRGIIFDKDGTLFEFTATWSHWADAVLERFAAGDPNRATMIGERIGYDPKARKFDPSSVLIAETTEVVAATLAPHFPDIPPFELQRELDRLAEETPQTLVPGLTGALTCLKAHGLRLGVCTNDTENAARAHLGGAGVSDLFDPIFGYDSGHGAKPSPDPLRAIAGLWGVEPHVCAMVGDSMHDLVAGKRAGMMTVGVLTGTAIRSDLDEGADVVLDSIAELPELLGLSSDLS